MIRTTNNQAAVHVLDDLQRVSANLQSTQRKLSTGKEINQVEDDPVGALQLLDKVAIDLQAATAVPSADPICRASTRCSTSSLPAARRSVRG